MKRVCDRMEPVWSAYVRKHGSGATEVGRQFRSPWHLLERAHVVLRRIEQRLYKGQVAVDRSRRQVSASRELLAQLMPPDVCGDRIRSTRMLTGTPAGPDSD